jgi:hypothetical protein
MHKRLQTLCCTNIQLVLDDGTVTTPSDFVERKDRLVTQHVLVHLLVATGVCIKQLQFEKTDDQHKRKIHWPSGFPFELEFHSPQFHNEYFSPDLKKIHSLLPNKNYMAILLLLYSFPDADMPGTDIYFFKFLVLDPCSDGNGGWERIGSMSSYMRISNTKQGRRSKEVGRLGIRITRRVNFGMNALKYHCRHRCKPLVAIIKE